MHAHVQKMKEGEESTLAAACDSKETAFVTDDETDVRLFPLCGLLCESDKTTKTSVCSPAEAAFDERNSPLFSALEALARYTGAQEEGDNHHVSSGRGGGGCTETTGAGLCFIMHHNKKPEGPWCVAGRLLGLWPK